MPNWCEVDLLIEGSTKDVKAFRDSVTIENPDDTVNIGILNTQYPTPSILLRIGAPTTVVETKTEAREINEKYNIRNIFDGSTVYKAITEKQEKLLMQRYGTTNWYDWNREHWGTKWSDSDTKVNDFFESSFNDVCMIQYYFRSPWGPPIEAIRYIAQKWPTLKFMMEYYEGGMGFQGNFVVENDNVIIDTTSDYEGFRGG